MSDATFTFRVDDDLKKQFALAAKERDRIGAQLLRDFMRDFVQQQ
jgi:predicted transcriptional regulator